MVSFRLCHESLCSLIPILVYVSSFLRYDWAKQVNADAVTSPPAGAGFEMTRVAYARNDSTFLKDHNFFSMLLLAEVPNLKRQHRHETVRAVSEILSFPPTTAGWWRSHRRVWALLASFHAVVFRRERCSTSGVALGARAEVSNICVCPPRAPEPCSVKYVLLLSLNTGFCADNSFVHTTPDLYVMFMLVIYLTCLLSKVPQAPLYFEIRNSTCHLFLY